MPDLWNNTEPFLKVMYIVLLICIPLFFLSVYQIWRWFRRTGAMERMRQRREARRKKPLSALYHRIGKARAIWYCAGCVLLITLSVALPLSLSAGWRIGGLIAGFVVLYLVNNWYVASRWRCPACGERLPCIVGRSALRPKWVETCPRCDYGDS